MFVLRNAVKQFKKLNFSAYFLFFPGLFVSNKSIFIQHLPINDLITILDQLEPNFFIHSILSLMLTMLHSNDRLKYGTVLFKKTWI